MTAGGVDEKAVTPDEMTVRAAVDVAFRFGPESGPSMASSDEANAAR